MTTLRQSQYALINVMGAPAATGVRLSQLAIIMVVANGKEFQQLGPVINLNCWTPCGVLAWNGS